MGNFIYYGYITRWLSLKTENHTVVGSIPTVILPRPHSLQMREWGRLFTDISYEEISYKNILGGV